MSEASTHDDVLVANDLRREFRVGGSRTVVAVDGVSLTLRRGRTIGLVGESGCGKTTTGRMLVGLDRPTSGSVSLDGEQLLRPNGSVSRRARRRVQMVFQDPQASLDPRMTAAQSISEPLRLSGMRRHQRARRVEELLDLVGLDADTGSRYPAALSGGQRQRVGIARALALEPAVLVADEPTSALDVSVRAQVVNLLKSLQQRLDLGLVFISHDLAMVRYLCDDIAVMYLGRVVESGPAAEVFSEPRHPYTRALIDAVPVPDPRVEATRRTTMLDGEIAEPAVLGAPSGAAACAFAPRCPHAFDRCQTETPLLLVNTPGRFAACHLAGSDVPLAAAHR